MKACFILIKWSVYLSKYKQKRANFRSAINSMKQQQQQQQSAKLLGTKMLAVSRIRYISVCHSLELIQHLTTLVGHQLCLEKMYLSTAMVHIYPKIPNPHNFYSFSLQNQQHLIAHCQIKLNTRANSNLNKNDKYIMKRHLFVGQSNVFASVNHELFFLGSISF